MQLDGRHVCVGRELKAVGVSHRVCGATGGVAGRNSKGGTASADSSVSLTLGQRCVLHFVKVADTSASVLDREGCACHRSRTKTCVWYQTGVQPGSILVPDATLAGATGEALAGATLEKRH